MTHTVYLVGAGPGDPDLLTLRALRVLARAEVVLHDRLVDPRILQLLPLGAEVIDVGKTCGAQARQQRRINALLVAHARAGRRVVRLKGGDPFVFGRGAEEAALLRDAGLEVEVVPGLSAALAVPALAGIPLTHRELSGGFAVVTGRRAGGPGGALSALAGADTLVVLMGIEGRAGLARELLAAGRSPDEPVAFVERGATPRQRVVLADLATVAEGGVAVSSPAVMVVGAVARLAADHRIPIQGRVEARTPSTLFPEPSGL